MFKRFLLSYCLLCIVPFIVLGFLISYITGEMVSRELINAAQISMDESYGSVRTLESDARRLSLAVATDDNVQQILRQYHDHPDSQYLRDLEVVLRIYTSYGSSNIKAKVAVYADDESSYNLIEQVAPAFEGQWLLDAQQNPNQFNWSLNMASNVTYLRQCKAIYDTGDWETVLGYAVVDINLESMRAIAMRANTGNSRLYLAESDGVILYPYYNYDKIPDEILLSTSQSTFNVGETIFLVRPVAGTNWKLIKTLHISDIREKTANVRLTIQIVALIFMLLSVLAATYYYLRMSWPISRLARRMKGVEAGELVPIPAAYRNDEIGELYSSYNYVIRSLKEQIEETYRSQLDAKEAELKALQAQINPHFLYNTLDSINWLALRNKANDISEMVIALSDMLRLSLNKGETIIQLKDELRQVESYIVLQKIRYNNRFEVHYEVDDSALNCRVVKMLFQPLIENALIHGFEETESDGIIIIQVKDHGELLELQVSNNGMLIDLDRMEQLVERPCDKNEFTHGYGIKNVNERLASFYGPQYKIRYKIDGDLTVATIIIPREVKFHDERSNS